MKSIVVEGHVDYEILRILFPDIQKNKIAIRPAQGFSGVFAVSKTLADYGFDVLAILDTDTHIPGNDNKKVMNRISDFGLIGRDINIVWMDSCLEDVLRKVDSNINLGYKGVVLQQSIHKNRDGILKLNEFKAIQEFINK